MAWRFFFTCLLIAGSVAGCGRQGDDLTIAFMESEEELFASGLRMSPGAQNLRAATGAGLVAFDANGEVVPALADRWIVTDDGRSFIFRLREGTWPDGQPLTAESVQKQVQKAIRSLRGTSLGLDLAPVEEVRAMAGRVVEFRLSSPVPTLLQLLAQPELSLTSGEGEAGPMVLARDGRTAELQMKPPEERGLPEVEDWEDYVRSLHISTMEPIEAVRAFDDGRVDVVLGGRFNTLTLPDTGPLSRGTVRLDAAIGLFGLIVSNDEGLLATPEGREALAMAIDRPALIEPFNIGGWVPTTRIAAPELPGDPGYIAERWPDLSIEERRAIAASRVAAFVQADANESADETEQGRLVEISVFIGQGPGADLLFNQLSNQLRTIGVRLERAALAAKPDLILIDRVARYQGPSWFLNQFNCTLRRGLCSNAADRLVVRAVETAIAAERDSLLAEAEAELMRENVYIPFGSPLRWSLVRGTATGYEPNRWAFHPLPPMATLPR